MFDSRPPPPAPPLFPYTTLFRSGAPTGAKPPKKATYRWYPADTQTSPSFLSTAAAPVNDDWVSARSEEHTSELQSLTNLVCRLLLEKKKTTDDDPYGTTRQGDRH